MIHNSTITRRDMSEINITDDADEACKKRFKDEEVMNAAVDKDPLNEDGETCRVCFGKQGAEVKIVRNCTWTKHHWVHLSCHRGLLKVGKHRTCTGCLNPTKMVHFEKKTIHAPCNGDQIRREYLELAEYMPLSQFRNDLLAIVSRLNVDVIYNTILPFECASPVIAWKDTTTMSRRRFGTSNAFARAFADSSLSEKVFMSENRDLIVDFLRRYYHLMLMTELGNPRSCNDRIMHHVLGIGNFDIVREVVTILKDELGHDVTSVSVLEHVGTSVLVDDWSMVQRYYDCLGTKPTSTEASMVLRQWPVHPTILRHALNVVIVSSSAKHDVWNAYLSGRVIPFENQRVETWTALMDLARPHGWCSDSWNRARIPAEVWCEYRPEYAIPGCTGAILAYPISRPLEATLYRWDTPWSECSAVFCHERGLVASEMDRIIERKWVVVIRDPKHGLRVLGLDTSPSTCDFTTISSAITLRSNLENFLDRMDPAPVELLRLGVGETVRVRIKYSTMIIVEVDGNGHILRAPLSSSSI